jgi:hypothetical protein
LQTEALPPANDFLFYESLKSPAAGATLEVFGFSKNIASTNLKAI